MNQPRSPRGVLSTAILVSLLSATLVGTAPAQNGPTLSAECSVDWIQRMAPAPITWRIKGVATLANPPQNTTQASAAIEFLRKLPNGAEVLMFEVTQWTSPANGKVVFDTEAQDFTQAPKSGEQFTIRVRATCSAGSPPKVTTKLGPVTSAPSVPVP